MAKFDQDIFREKVREILKGYKQEYKKIIEPLINKILKFINQGESVYNAVTMALAETSFFNANSKAITDAMFLAACSGYGVSPSIMTATSMENIKNRLLSESWTGDKMKLSKRLHGSSKIMRQNIIDTISSGMRKSLMLKELAMKLYNGYNSKQGMLNKAEIPKYLEELRRTALMVANGDVSMLKDFRKALENAEANIKTLNSKNLKATYNELLSAAKNLNEKAINRTVRSVIEEKTRYHAERIARTETVRAWFDGFIAENQEDNEVFGYRWVLSSRHKLVPFDQCDVCANMNVGYGKGIYPKNKVPSIPRHPHCMCMLEVVYTWEIDVNAPLNPDGAREYIDSLNEQRKNSLFGIDGAKAYQQGDDWQKLLRGWDGFGEPKSRLDGMFESGGFTSGALTDKNDPTGARRDTHAEKYYATLRNNGSKSFVDKIFQNTSIPKGRLARIYDHVFVNKYHLEGGHKTFDPSFEMAQSFQRLLSGKGIRQYDLTLLKHEHLELAIMKKLGYNYNKSHDLTNTKYNYALEANKWEQEYGKD